MYDFTKLTEDEVRYICEQMDLSKVRKNFQKEPIEFNKIKPGFTVKKMTDKATLDFLVKYSNKPFVEKHIKDEVAKWLSQIQDNCALLEKNGYSSGEALLKVIPDCVFCDRIELYFKLTEHDNNDDYLKLLSDALSLVKKLSDTAIEEHNIELQNTEIDRLTSEIQTISKQLNEAKGQEVALKLELDGVNEQLHNTQFLLNDTTNKLRVAESSILDMHKQLERYQVLEKYADSDVPPGLLSDYQYTSIGQIIYDYDKRWILRLADISESGEILPFVVDKMMPRQWSNRDRLHWNDGPEEEKVIGVWNWNTSPRDTAPDKDYVETEYSNNIQLTQIVQLSNCESLDDVVNLLKNGLSMEFACNKLLFVYEDNSTLNGLLCTSADFNRYKILKSSVYTLPKYIIKQSDVIKLAGIRIYKKLSLGIPQSIYQVLNPYEAVKSLIISRVTNANFREYGLSKKEIQHCRNYLTAIPTQTLIQELTLAYNCSNETAQEYIDGFISLADTYLSSTDIDLSIISRAIQGNADLIYLCKQQLTDEWKSENGKMIIEAEAKLADILESIDTKQKELNQLEDKRNILSDEMKQLQSSLSQREQLALDVETKISMQIEEAKKNAADFISNMAFVSPITSSIVSNSNCISIFDSHINCVESGEIDDIETFEEELIDNLTLIGYSDEQSIEISQAISFGIFENIPLVISDNSKRIAQCLAAVLNGGTVSELFIPLQGIRIEELYAAINKNLDKASPMVCLIHGIFDGYSINLFNAISSTMQNWDNVIILLSIEGTPAKMVMPGVWNYSIFIDGDREFEKKSVDSLHSFTLHDSFDLHDRTIDMKSKEYKNAKKSIKLFKELLSNTQIGMYSRYLTTYNTLLNDSNLILTQLIATARSIGNSDYLKELFHENGIVGCEELFD